MRIPFCSTKHPGNWKIIRTGRAVCCQGTNGQFCDKTSRVWRKNTADKNKLTPSPQHALRHYFAPLNACGKTGNKRRKEPEYYFPNFWSFFFYRAASNQNLSSFFFFFFLFPKDLRIRQLRLTSVLTLCLLPSKILRTRLSQVASDLTLSLSFSKP